MSEFVVINPKKFNVGRKKKFKKGNVVKLTEAEGLRWANKGIVDLTVEEKKIKAKKEQKKRKESLDEMIGKLTIDELLSQEKPKYTRLGIGIHNDIFYQGTSLWAFGKQCSAIITSDKKIYVAFPEKNEIIGNFGLTYRVDFEEESLEYSWSNKAIQQY